MNNHCLIIIIISLFFITCSDKNDQIISNTPSDLPDQNYKLNLQSNSGENINSVTISWNETDGEVQLIDSNTFITPTSNSHIFKGMDPGEFKDIIITIDNNSTFNIDNIQIFTRNVFPVSNFQFEVNAIKVGENIWNEGEPFTDLGDGIWNSGEQFEDRVNGIYDEEESFEDLNDNDLWDEGEPFEDEVNGIYNEGEPFIDLGNGVYDEGEPFNDNETTKYYRNISWSPTLESNEAFLEYNIFRSDDPAQLISPNSCNNCKLKTLSLSDSTYIDSSSEVSGNSGQDQTTFYYSIQVSVEGFTQNSHIYNYSIPSPFESIQLTDGVSSDKNEFIEITWEPISITATEYFYQYEIWRSSNKELTNETRIAIITDPEQQYFMDRTVGNGTTWYYSLVVVDVAGGKSFSDYVSGWSMP